MVESLGNLSPYPISCFMFGRHVITVGMTALVLLCPFLPCGECRGMCLAAETQDSVENSNDRLDACCGRCKTQGENQHDERPSPVQRDCPAGSEVVNCFCGGAILPAGTDCPDLNQLADFDSLPMSDATDGQTRLAMRSQSGVLATNGCHFPPLASGRDLCAWSGSYLL